MNQGAGIQTDTAARRDAPHEAAMLNPLTAAASVGNELALIIDRLELIDRVLREHFDYNLLSGEGRVFFNTIKNNGSMLKVIANNPGFSYRTAFNGIKKLESSGLLKKSSNNDDLRRVIVKIDVERIIELLEKAA